MTSTRSAAANPLPSRRSLVVKAGMLASIGAPSALMAIPAYADEPGPIEAMWPDYLRAEAALDAATAHTSDAERHYKAPPRPVWHPFYEDGGYVTIMTGPNSGVCVLDDGVKNIADLTAIIAMEHEPDDLRFGYSNGPRAERARKTLAKIEAWQGEVKAPQGRRWPDRGGDRREGSVGQALRADCSHPRDRRHELP